MHIFNTAVSNPEPRTRDESYEWADTAGKSTVLYFKGTEAERGDVTHICMMCTK